MDTAQVTALVATMFGIVTVLVAIFALMWQMTSQSSRLEDKVDSQGSELRDEIRAMGARVSNSKLEQARLNGVNSVSASQSHTHDTPGN